MDHKSLRVKNDMKCYTGNRLRVMTESHEHGKEPSALIKGIELPNHHSGHWCPKKDRPPST